MKPRISRRIAGYLAFVSAVSPALANYSCSGVIEQLALNPSGVVTVFSSGAGLSAAYVCQIGVTINGVGPEACKAIYSMLDTAVVTQQQVSWYFTDALTCAAPGHPAWTWLTGWYYGPVLLP